MNILKVLYLFKKRQIFPKDKIFIINVTIHVFIYITSHVTNLEINFTRTCKWKKTYLYFVTRKCFRWPDVTKYFNNLVTFTSRWRFLSPLISAFTKQNHLADISELSYARYNAKFLGNLIIDSHRLRVWKGVTGSSIVSGVERPEVVVIRPASVPRLFPAKSTFVKWFEDRCHR